MEKTIWLVIEQGTGIIHKAFDSKKDAGDFIEVLKIESEMDCYEIHPIDYQS